MFNYKSLKRKSLTRSSMPTSPNSFNTETSPMRSYKQFNTSRAFAVLKDDGSVVTWGGGNGGHKGGDSSGVSAELISGVTEIFSNYEILLH